VLTTSASELLAVDWLGVPSTGSLVVFLLGWGAGWVGFLRAKSLPQLPSTERVNDAERTNGAARATVSVIVPCRNEADNLQYLLPSLHAALRPTDEVIIVDDDSTDNTAAVAAGFTDRNVQVLPAGSLPAGWAGKSHACWIGAQRASREVLLFVDADVRIAPGAVDDIAALAAQHTQAVVSAMPYHRTVGVIERLSMLFNTVSAMVASVVSTREPRRVAYGPFVAVHRDAYLRVGGHAHQHVRGAVVEDLALARVMPRAVAVLAREQQVEYRMYPLGMRQLVEGWTKNTAIGANSVPRWSAALIIVWVVSLCGGPLTSVWCYVLSAAQVAVMSRRVGNFGVVSAMLYPLHAIVFVTIALRSVARSVLVGRVAWRGRTIATR